MPETRLYCLYVKAGDGAAASVRRGTTRPAAAPSELDRIALRQEKRAKKNALARKRANESNLHENLAVCCLNFLITMQM